MKKRILCVTPGEEGGQPIRTACFKSAMQQADWIAKAIDLSQSSIEEVNGCSFDVVLLVVMDFPAISNAEKLVADLKLRFPSARLIVAGEYAKLHKAWLNSAFNTDVVESLAQDEEELVRLLTGKEYQRGRPSIIPDRSDFPTLDAYGFSKLPSGRVVSQGNLEGSRGCHHRCRYCSVEALYLGKQARVEPETVIADALQQWEMGARHFGFIDADFFNFAAPACELIAAINRLLPAASFEVVTRVDHICELSDEKLIQLREQGLCRITSALEFPDETVLSRIDKGFTLNQIEVSIKKCEKAGIELKPTFLTFTPWVGIADVLVKFPRFLEATGLDKCTPIENRFTRLLLYKGSPLLERNAEIRAVCTSEELFHFDWAHPDDAMDELYARVATDGRCCIRC